MQAHKLIVIVPKSRRIELTLPDDVPEGEAEVIVLAPRLQGDPTQAFAASAPAANDAIDEWRAQNPDKLLSRDAIDAQLREERDSWGDP